MRLPSEITKSLETSLIARGVRVRFANEFRERWNAGQIASPIRDLTQMVGKCQHELRSLGLEEEAEHILNLTIGDMEPRFFATDGALTLADELGHDPAGETRQKINTTIAEIRQQAWLAGSEPRAGYQPDALGLPMLRSHYADFISQYGLVYTVPKTVLSFGSLQGIQSLLETVHVLGGHDSTYVAPIPNFSVINTQAKRRGMNVVLLPTSPETGYCPTGEGLGAVLAELRQNKTILYLTPMNNPTSTTYDADTLRETLRTFKTLRPDGVVLMDLAYIEMIPRDVAIQILRTLDETDTTDQAVLALSMSKIFGYPRLRSGALITKNVELLAGLQGSAQVNYASLSGPGEMEAEALWRHVTPAARQHLFDHLKRRQDALIDRLRQLNDAQQASGKPHVVNLARIHREIPLYVYAELTEGFDPLDLFVESGICGIPGKVFGDQSNTVRFSTGIEPIANLVALS